MWDRIKCFFTGGHAPSYQNFQLINKDVVSGEIPVTCIHCDKHGVLHFERNKDVYLMIDYYVKWSRIL